MDRSILWRAALVQTLGVAVLALVLALALPHSFFVDWGWVVGPGAWMLCAAITAGVLALPLAPALLGAALAAVPSVLAAVLGAHWVGVGVAVVGFALWCARLARDRDVTARVV